MDSNGSFVPFTKIRECSTSSAMQNKSNTPDITDQTELPDLDRALVEAAEEMSFDWPEFLAVEVQTRDHGIRFKFASGRRTCRARWHLHPVLHILNGKRVKSPALCPRSMARSRPGNSYFHYLAPFAKR
jgi:hypothetical protein